MSLRLVARTRHRRPYSVVLALALSAAIAGGVRGVEPPSRSLLILSDDLEELELSQPADSTSVPRPSGSSSLTKARASTGTAADGLFRLSNTRPSPQPSEGDEVESIRERFPNGSLRIERQVALDSEGNYVNHGPYQEWNEKGQLIVSGEFQHGLRTGTWIQFLYTTQGGLLAASPYSEFDAPFLSEADFEDDLLEGTWRISDAKGRLASSIEFQKGLRHGKAEWYFVNGNPFFRADYVDGLLNGDAIEFLRDGNIKRQDEYVQGRRTEIKREFHRERVPKMEVTVLTTAQVLKSADDWQATRMATYEARGDATRHGPFTVWHENGQVRARGSYHMNQINGEYESWYESGDRESRGSFEVGQMVGTWTWWHRNGMKRAHGTYTAGQPEGQWRAWSVDGKLVRQESFDTKQLNVTTPDSFQSPRLANVPGEIIR